MKKVGKILLTSFFISSIIFVGEALYASKETMTRPVLREAITWQQDATRSSDFGLPLKLTTSLTVPPTYLQMAVNKLSEWGLPIDKGDPKAMALTGLLLAVIL